MVEKSTFFTAVDPEHPWPGLYAYTEEQEAYFHGREAESDELLRRVRGKVLTVLFGQSGLGKSSLLQAGLFPRLRQEGMRPILVRLHFRGESEHAGSETQPGLAGQVWLALGADEQDPAGGGGGSAAATEPLWTSLRRADASSVPVFVFDQFEELFTRGSETAEGRAQVTAFLRELADLVEDRPPAGQSAPAGGPPRYRVLLALREDYLAHLESWREEMPSLLENRMRLRALDGESALRAIARPAALRLPPAPPLVTPSVARQLVRFLAGGETAASRTEGCDRPITAAWDDFARLTVDPALLSLVLRELNDSRRATAGLEQITPELLAETGQVTGILRAFYRRTIEGEHPAVRELVEDQLLTDVGFRDNISVARAEKFLRKAGADPTALERLVGRRLLRVEERLEQRRVELAHDVLCGIVRESGEERRKAAALEQLESERAAEAAARVHAEAEREKEVRAREYAERIERRARRIALVAGVVAALAITAGAAAYWQWQQADLRKREAQHATTRAEAEEERAEKALAATAIAKTQADAEKERAQAARKDAEGLIRFMQYDLRDSLEKLGRLDMMEGINRRIREYYERNRPATGDAAAEREQGVTLNQQGSILLARGDAVGALASYRDSLAIAKKLAEQDPSNADWQRDLCFCCVKVGDGLSAKGDAPGALASYRDSLAIAKKLAEQDPSNADWQRDLCFCCMKVGDGLNARGDAAGALASYRDSLAIRKKLAEQDPSNVDWQRDLSVSYNKVGDGLLAQGDAVGALASYRDSLAIRKKLAVLDPSNAGWQRDLSLSYDNVGNMLRARGDAPGALASFRDSLAIRKKLAVLDPSNAGWQRDLSVSYNKVGDGLLAQDDAAGALASFRDSLAIGKKLAEQDPSNAGWQRNLSVSYDKVGDVLLGKGDAAGALGSFRDSLAIRKKLAEQHPSNDGWQRDLSVSYDKVGNVLLGKGDAAGALASFRGSLAIAEKLAVQDPSNADWQGDLAYSCLVASRALLRSRPGEPAAREEALTLLRHGRERLVALGTKVGSLSPERQGWLKAIEGDLAELESSPKGGNRKTRRN